MENFEANSPIISNVDLIDSLQTLEAIIADVEQVKRLGLEELSRVAEDREEAQQQVLTLKQELTQKSVELERAHQHLQKLENQLQDSQDESEQRLLQLHKVQEELEHFFHFSRQQSQFLSSYSDLQQRIAVLISVITKNSIS